MPARQRIKLLQQSTAQAQLPSPLCVVPQVKAALVEAFPSYDVIEFFGNTTSFEQLDLFARVSMVVAPHGAGLVNMMVSPLLTPILEIGPAACPICYVAQAIKASTCAQHCAMTLPDDRSGLLVA